MHDTLHTEPTCIYCQKEPIKVQSLKMGASCYRKFRIVTGREKGRKADFYLNLTQGQREKYKAHLIATKGQQFVDDILSLETKPFTTHVALAEKYGLSRERIRQLYLYMTGRSWRTIRLARDAEARRDIGCKYDPRNKLYAMPEGDTFVRRGTETEVLFLQECQKCGFVISCPPGRDCDTVVNGFNIEIKLGGKMWRSSSRTKTLYAHATLTERSFKVSDFIAFYHKPIQAWFIIPMKAVPDCGSIYISAEPSTYYNAKNRYWEYREAWDLLATPSHPILSPSPSPAAQEYKEASL